MKLIIFLSVVACSYGDKLDRTYLPPANAATAGGTPGSLTAPLSGPNLPSGPSTFAQAVEQGFETQSGPNFQSSKSGFESASQYQPGASGPQFGQSGQSSPGAESPAFGQALNPFSGNQGSFKYQGPEDATVYSGQYQSQPERAQASADKNSETLRYDSQNDGDNFAYSFETSNGINVEESGVATNGVQAQGGYSYTGDDGQQYRVTYTADENGYQPQGDHLPTPHPIPEEILKSLEENARAAADGTQEGAYQPEEESNFGSQQYSNGAPSYQGLPQQSGPAPSAYNQPGQAPSSQYGAPSASRDGSDKFSGSQGYQYQAGSNQGLSQNARTAAGLSFPRGQAPEDQGPSPSTPTGSNVFAPSGPRQPAQNQGQFGSANPARQGEAPGQSGYQYSRPEASSPSAKNNEPGQFRPQDQPFGSFKPQTQRPDYTKPQSYGPTGSSDQAQGPSNQGFGPVQRPIASGEGNGPTFGSSGTISGPVSPPQGSPFPRPNGAQAYTPAGQSAAPSTSQGSTFPRPSTSSNDNGYVYGPGISSGPIAAKSSGQGFAPSGPSGPAGPSSSRQESYSRGPIGQGPASNSGSGFAPQGSKPSRPAQYSQAFPRPNGPVGGPTGADKGPFGGAPQYQPSAQQEQDHQGSAFSRPNGSIAPKAQGPFGVAPQYQPNKSSPSAQNPLGPAFPRPTGPAVGPNNSAPRSQGPFGTASQTSGPKSSILNQSAPYEYNRPGSQASQSGSTQNTAGYQPGFRTPEARPGQTFGEPREPPSFSPEEGYKY